MEVYINMPKKDKIINGVEHQNNTFKEQGKIYKFIEKCPLGVIIFLPLLFILIEMVVFAFLYMGLSSSSFGNSFSYSMFSSLGEMVDTSVKKAFWINRIISIQLIITNCIISFFMAVVLYKFMSIKPKLIKVEDHLVFDPSSGTLRLRIVNVSRFKLKNVYIKAYFRLHIPESNRHAWAKLNLKIDEIVCLEPYKPWNIATKPFKENSELRGETKLDIGKYDRERICDFIPDMLNEKYRSDDIELAKSSDYINLHITITYKSPLFDTDRVHHEEFMTKDFCCGQLKSIERHKSGETIMNWSNWGQYDDQSESHCKGCSFEKNCSIIKKEKMTIS